MTSLRKSTASNNSTEFGRMKPSIWHSPFFEDLRQIPAGNKILRIVGGDATSVVSPLFHYKKAVKKAVMPYGFYVIIIIRKIFGRILDIGSILAS
ncbi:MAG: hypothetical protein IJB67_00235 [Firmicutes bacterium]|nr:hypothetical protein [Bacillota bacterium]